MKQKLQKLILKTFFTPVRAIKLRRAWVRADQELTTVSTMVGRGFGINMYLHYGSSLDTVYYAKDEFELFQQERQLLESMIERPNK